MRGMDVHYCLEEDYNFCDNRSKIPRGTLEINHEAKTIHLMPYHFTGKPTTDMETFFRDRLKIPADYSTKPHISQATAAYCMTGA